MPKPPRNPRETFILLASLQTTDDFDEFLDRIDWQDASPQQICYAVLGQLPLEIYYRGLSGSAFDPKSHFKLLLLGTEFQSGIIASLLGAFPERPRVFFVHIPKSGGTSVGELLEARGSAVIHSSITEPDWVVGRDFIDHVAKICRTIQNAGEIHVAGHYTLRGILNNRLVRFGDKVWTIVRPPRDIMLSFFNYILTTLESDPDLTRPDVRYWAASLALQPPWTTDDLAGLLPNLLASETLVPRDMLSHFLGDGTAASAIDLLAAADVEVVNQTNLDDWLDTNWNIKQSRRSNVSKPFFKWDGLRKMDQDKIESLISQDFVLYGFIDEAIAGETSASGTQIARLASQLPRAEPAVPATPRAGRAARPILRDPRFLDIPIVPAGLNAFARARLPRDYQGWATPPLNFRTIETTLQLPLMDTRIRVRYARHERGLANAGLRLLRRVKLKGTARRAATLFGSILKPKPG